MKKLIIFLLMPFFLFSGLVSELGKVPALFSHFDDHQAINADLTMADFLAMHYFGDDFDNSDNNKDNSLPFKKPKSVEELPVLFFASEQTTDKTSSVVQNSRTPLPKYKRHSSEAFGGKDLQPPQRI